MGNDAVRLAPTRDSDERLPERRPREDPDYGYDPVDDPDAPSTGSQPPNMITMQLHLLADREFDGAATSFGRGTLNEHVALVNALDGIYRRTVNVTFQLASSSTDSGSIPCFTATTSSALLDQVKTCFKQLNRSVALGPSDLVHLTSGKTLESRFLGFGHVLGIAFEPGQFGLSTSRLATVIGGVGDLPNLSFEDLLVSAHEIGHNLDGCHKEADSWCDGYFLFFCIGPRNTIMAPIISGATSGFFSAAGFDGAHNNVDRIKFNTTHRIGDTVARTCPN